MITILAVSFEVDAPGDNDNLQTPGSEGSLVYNSPHCFFYYFIIFQINTQFVVILAID